VSAVSTSTRVTAQEAAVVLGLSTSKLTSSTARVPAHCMPWAASVMIALPVDAPAPACVLPVLPVLELQVATCVTDGAAVTIVSGGGSCRDKSGCLLYLAEASSVKPA
jgi:hypothetical protein